ncbi:DMT family transporter [Roseovarius sp. LXJ103]|uniref:DMT family transporter n=1 Tax=Roseovarius carneus TaxID=2853164 RepID=UPI000D608C04|nr:DMT family transporter [Roseovarius carneus]MBZ8118196.1 DMT family transporter [Roseovarius carneus]PWE36076.1 EamA family transporter [Pelagicola sp. LXJ1103]
MTPPTALNWLFLVSLGLIWGASFMFVTIALEGVGPFMLVACRLCMGALLLLGIAYVRGTGLPPMRGEGAGIIWLCVLAMGVLSNALPFFLLGWGQQHVASGFAGVCMSIVPLLVLPLAHFFVPGGQMHLRRLIGFLIGTCGVIMLIGPDALAQTGTDFETTARLGFVAAAACYAMGSIVTRLCPAVDMLSLSAAALGVGALIITPIALMLEPLPSDLSTRSLLALLYLGILPTGIAQLMLVNIIRSAGPVFMSLVNYQVPIWSVILGVLVLSEDLPSGAIAALGLILFGVALSQLGALKRLFQARRRT